MLDQTVLERLELARCDVEIVVHQGKKFRFQDIDLLTADATHTGVVGIVVVAIVKKFDCLHDAVDVPQGIINMEEVCQKWKRIRVNITRHTSGTRDTLAPTQRNHRASLSEILKSDTYLVMRRR